jgi:hypothetical protein
MAYVRGLGHRAEVAGGGAAPAWGDAATNRTFRTLSPPMPRSSRAASEARPSGSRSRPGDPRGQLRARNVKVRNEPLGMDWTAFSVTMYSDPPRLKRCSLRP